MSEDEEPLPGLEQPSWVDKVQPLRAFDFFEKVRNAIVHPRTGLPFEPTRRSRPLTVENLAFETGWGLRVGLQVFAPVMVVLFALSFLWDFHGLLRSCSVAGLIGFGTNWVAIKMLFWPREPRPVFGHGLIPSQRDQLIDKVATEVLENLINEEIIFQKIEETKLVSRFTGAVLDKVQHMTAQPEFKDDLRRVILTYVAEMTSDPEFRAGLVDRADKSLEDFAGERFRGWLVKRLKEVWRAPLIGLVNSEVERLEQTIDEGLGHLDGVLERLPVALADRQEQIDRMLTQMLLGLVQEVDIRQIVYDQLATVTTEQLEQGFREFSDDKLSFITLLGGLLGVVGGTVIIWPLQSAAVLSGGLLLLWIADQALAPFTKSRTRQ